MPEALTRSTGLRRRAPERRRQLQAERPYPTELRPLVTVFQPVLAVHDQDQKPSCVGHAITACAEAFTSRRFSAVDTWTDARRRQGDFFNFQSGTDAEHAIASAIYRGFSPWRPGEDQRSVADDIQIAELGAELAADDERLPRAAEHRTIPEGLRVRSVSDALQGNHGAMVADGVRAGYDRLGLDEIADASCLGANNDGHEQRIVAVISPDDERFPAEQRGCALYQNSWGEGWGGYTLPCSVWTSTGALLLAGTVLRGCVLVRGECVERAWDVDVLSFAGL